MLSFRADLLVLHVNDRIAANFGDPAFVGAVPTGFTSGFTAGATPTSYAIPTQIGVEAWAAGLPAVQLTQIGVEAFGQSGGAAQLTQVASEVFGSVSGVTTQAVLTIIAAEVFAKITHAPLSRPFLWIAM